MKIGASIQGCADLEKRLRSLPEAVSFKVQRDALVAGAEPIRLEASILAPRDQKAGPPHLADHIIIDALTPGEVEKGIDTVPGHAVVEVGPNANHFYGYFSEYGTARQPARPWFRPAFDRKSSQALNIALTRLWESIRRFASVGGSSVGTVGSRNL